MSYRDPGDSLRARRDRVAAALDEARQAAREAEERAALVEALERELVETDQLLRTLGKGALPLLDNVQIAAPCTAEWDAMAGDDRVRFCAQCEKNVYNLSAMRREDAEALLRHREGSVCVRIFRRADGTVMTSDCAVGVKRRRRRRVVGLALAGGLASAAAAAASAQTHTVMGSALPAVGQEAPSFVMGEAPLRFKMGQARVEPDPSANPKGQEKLR